MGKLGELDIPPVSPSGASAAVGASLYAHIDTPLVLGAFASQVVPLNAEDNSWLGRGPGTSLSFDPVTHEVTVLEAGLYASTVQFRADADPTDPWALNGNGEMSGNGYWTNVRGINSRVQHVSGPANYLAEGTTLSLTISTEEAAIIAEAALYVVRLA